MTPNKPTPPPVHYDPFSYPHLYPSGWNLEDGGEDRRSPASEASDPEPDPKGSSMPSWYEPFQDLRTFPSGWDLP